MDDIGEFIDKFFDTGSFPPRWHCGRWSDFHGWLYIISDVAIWAAYFTIPFLLIRFIRKKKDIPFPKIFWLFGMFILACGTTHLIDAVIFWLPIYRVSAFVRALTAIVSWATIVALYRVLPKAFLLRTPAELERQVAIRTTELNDTINKMRFMADAMPQMVYTAKPDGTRDYFNKRTLEFTGKSYDDLEGWKWTDFMHPDDRELFQQKWTASVEEKKAFEYEVRILSANGQYYWHLTRALPQFNEDGEVACWVGTATEIEQQKRAAEYLENTVAERTEELRVANEQLRQSNKDLELFAGFASHDLQAPLRVMRNYLGILSERNKEVLDENSITYISKAMTASSKMQNLIETLLQFSKINGSVIKMEEVDLAHVVETIRTGISEGNHSQVIINNNAGHKLAADETMISQLLQNLIYNGIKYNDNDVAVIDIATKEHDGNIIISVADNGIGIESKNIAKIFDAFTRIETTIAGSGLGLSISKRIAEKHHGSITVTSEVGRGTTFYVSIPNSVIQ